MLYVAWALGVIGFASLIAWGGAGQIAASFAAAGFGPAGVVAYHLLPMALDTLGWQVLMPTRTRRPFARLLLFRWCGEAVNALIPLGQVGGELLRGHLHAGTGVPGPVAIGIAVVDLAATVYAQSGFAAIGLIGLALIASGQGDLIWRLSAALGLLVALIFGFYVAQKKGMFTRIVGVLEMLALGQNQQPRAYAEAMDHTIRRLYRRRQRLAASVGLHLLSWVFGAGEVWLAAYFIGKRITVPQAVVIESLVDMVRGAAFLMPSALGAQEGAFVALGGLFGLAPDQALAISLIRRVRELALGVPGLLVWQAIKLKRIRVS
ncbi:MAG: flippase-like domain-containing protein [Acetobacteraceae bacterium]|nr:flippase-like domain-containing protein [Acetobacteraceae bacterium]MBV8525028.1 flippase-like domain-containing protein [Acetobacteraceae bacterium]